MHPTEEIFSSIGGSFNAPFELFLLKLSRVRAFVFDWDGVFTDGQKAAGENSSFSEADSMGLNLLRFCYYLRTGEVPPFFIITGLQNGTAVEFAKRECFNGVFLKVRTKQLALEYLQAHYQTKPEEVAFFYDDVLDLSISSRVGLRFLLTRSSSPIFTEYTRRNHLYDYRTAHAGGDHGLRECAELCLSSLGMYESVIEQRIHFTESYSAYWSLRQQVKPSFFVLEGDRIISAER